MPLTPLDIDNRKLRVAFRGYDRADVDHLRAEVAASIEEYVDQIGRLRARVRELESELSRFRESEDTLKGAVMLAQRTADELISAARERAGSVLAQAESEADSVRRSVADVASQREQFEYAFYGLLTGFLQRLEHGNPALSRKPQGSALPAASASVKPDSAVSHSMDTQREDRPVGDPAVNIDMEDLTSKPGEVVEHDEDGEDTVVMPMTAPAQPRQRRDVAAWTPQPARPPDALRTDLDADSDEFTAALEQAGQGNATPIAPPSQFSGSPPHGPTDRGPQA